MPELREKIIKILCQYNELSIVKLIEKTSMGNRNTAFEIINQLEKDGHVKTRKEGRERLVSLSSPDKKVRRFIDNFSKNLDYYEKTIKKSLKGLEKNNPLVSAKNPMKKIKSKTGVLELDKKTHTYRDLGKTQDSFLYTWKTRLPARRHFDILLNLLNRIYQESSALTFAGSIDADSKLVSEYQRRANKMIRDTVRKIERMYENDGPSLHYSIFNIRNTLYGIIYRNSLENQIKT